jgi:hypothetical protein
MWNGVIDWRLWRLANQPLWVTVHTRDIYVSGTYNLILTGVLTLRI